MLCRSGNFSDIQLLDARLAQYWRGAAAAYRTGLWRLLAGEIVQWRCRLRLCRLSASSACWRRTATAKAAHWLNSGHRTTLGATRLAQSALAVVRRSAGDGGGKTTGALQLFNGDIGIALLNAPAGCRWHSKPKAASAGSTRPLVAMPRLRDDGRIKPGFGIRYRVALLPPDNKTPLLTQSDLHRHHPRQTPGRNLGPGQCAGGWRSKMPRRANSGWRTKARSAG